MRQPLGVFPGAAGFFLLPKVENGTEIIEMLLKGFFPDPFPKDWEFFKAAIDGESVDTVIQLMPDTKERYFNQFILLSDQEHFQRAKETLPKKYLLILEAVAWRQHLISTPPEYGQVTDEMKAFLLATHAYDAFQKQQWKNGLNLLQQAAQCVQSVSPIFAARLLSEKAATIQMLEINTNEMIEDYQLALSLLKKSNFQQMRAELLFQLGAAYQNLAVQNRSSLLEAIKCYNEALQTFQAEDDKEAFAMTHMNLALAYLMVPETDNSQELKTVTAIQSLRTALQYFKKETHPEYWASVTLNLANALQYAKSSHIEDNLWEAVSLYEEILQVRKKDTDLLGYARVIANQGTALSHLGAFTRAVPQLKNAQKIFQQVGDLESVEMLENTLTDIAQKQLKAKQS